jgi:hypothetical protein
MGIYSSDNIFGIQMYNFYNDFSNVLFEKTYNNIMSNEQKKEAYLFYTKLNNKNDVKFKIFTECSSTYDLHNNENFMMWYPISLNQFLDFVTF